MKFAICNETFEDMSIVDSFRLAAEIGYAGIELAPFTLARSFGIGVLNDVRMIPIHERKRLRRIADEFGLDIVGLHWLFAETTGFHLTSPDSGIRKNTASYLVALGQLCHDVGGRILVLGSPKHRDIPPKISNDCAENFAVEVISQSTRILEDLGVTLAIEPLGPNETNFINTAATAARIIDRVDSVACKLHLDVKAMANEQIPIIETIRSYGDELAHFHANDPNLFGPGMGDVDFVPILQTLVDISYDDWVSVEVFRYEPSGQAVATESYNNLMAAMKLIS